MDNFQSAIVKLDDLVKDLVLFFSLTVSIV
nr:MAG TPA_asm: hypothetical protein [Caudoviricetes sp.]